MKLQFLLGTLLTTFMSAQALAFLAISESGEITPPGTFRIGVEPQLRISDGSGGNVGFFVDSAVNDEWSWRGQLGTGDTDFWGSASAKWIPIPDLDSQPAIGLRPEVAFGRDESESFTVFRLAPMISKKLDTEIGVITPYIAVPIGIFAWQGKSDTISQFVVGSEGKFEEMPTLLFTAELGMNMSKTFSYIAGSISFFFDGSK
jgi:hypothetical protein